MAEQTTSQLTENTRKYYVRKPYQEIDFIFLKAVDKLMSVWDISVDRLDELVKILEEMRKPTNRFACNDLIDVIQSSKTGFVKNTGNYLWNADYNDKIMFFLLLLAGETRYKMIKEIWPLMKKPYFVLELLIINEFATLEDVRDAFARGIKIDKDDIGKFKEMSFKEYNPDKHEHYYKLVYEIVSCIEHSSYVYNTQICSCMYKQFGISGQQVKKADFIANKQNIVSTDTIKILEKIRQRVK